MSNDDYRLIEDYLPIEAISIVASREKSGGGKGHISELHLWWARRPLVACRAAVYSALVPASRFRPTNGSKNKRDSLMRANAAKFIERLCAASLDPKAIADAEKHILEAHAERLSQETGEYVCIEDIIEGQASRPKVLDIFAGGGAIPLEALRLGCDAHALDLNPVAHIIQTCTLVFPQKYGKSDPTVAGKTGIKNNRNEKTWGGLAKEMRFWGDRVLEKVKVDIGDLYPLIPDPDHKGRQTETQAMFGWSDSKDDMLPGYLIPIIYLWTRTVNCKNPNCGAIVPLVKQTWLCKKAGRYVALKLIASKGEKKVKFKVVEVRNEKELDFDPSFGSSRGNAICKFCGTVADSDYVKEEGCQKRMGQQLMAIICTQPGSQGKIYFSADDLPEFLPEDKIIQERSKELCKRKGISIPNEPIISDVKNTHHYGLTTFGDLYNARQMHCLLSFVDAILEISEEIKKEIPEDYANAVITMLAMSASKLSDFCSSLCTLYYRGGRGIVNTFKRQVLPMVWDFAETNPFNPAASSWPAIINNESLVIENLSNIDLFGNVKRGSAMQLPYSDQSIDVIVTDPPYYDNVPYANISDFFYIWLKRILGGIYPEHFATEGTPKRNEAVVNITRHNGDWIKAKDEYETMMRRSFSESKRVLKENGQLVVIYAHKTTLGWATLIDALRQSGFMVIEAWPLDTENTGRAQAQESAALATSIFLVARKREEFNHYGQYDEVRPELEKIVRDRVDVLWKMHITGADLLIAAVGAGLRAFTRFARVEYANGEEVPAEKFLSEVEGVVLETLLEKIFRVVGRGVAAVDGPSRFYVLWRHTYKSALMGAGEAIVFTYGQNVELDGQNGLSTGSRALIEKNRGKYRLYDFTERGGNEKLGLPANDGTPAPLIDVLHRILWLVENEPRNIKDFLDEAQPDQERLLFVAQALAGPALTGKRYDMTENFVGNTIKEESAIQKLLTNWRSIIIQPLTASRGELL